MSTDHELVALALEAHRIVHELNTTIQKLSARGARVEIDTTLESHFIDRPASPIVQIEVLRRIGS